MLRPSRVVSQTRLAKREGWVGRGEARRGASIAFNFNSSLTRTGFRDRWHFPEDSSHPLKRDNDFVSSRRGGHWSLLLPPLESKYGKNC
jgi:hypothetical protein